MARVDFLVATVVVMVMTGSCVPMETCIPCREYFARLQNRTEGSCRCLYNEVYSPYHPLLIADCHNLVTVPDFTAICNVSDVYSVNLQQNSITEIGAYAFRTLEISDRMMSWAGVTPELILLQNKIDYIHQDAFRGPMEGKLAYLDIKNNGLVSIPEAIYTLVNLTKLYLRDNRITVAEGSPRLAKLRELDLRSNQLRQFPASLCNFPSLRHLYLDSNPISTNLADALPDLVRCENLRVLTWPQETVPCNQTQLELYANTSVCKEMIVRSQANRKVMCDGDSSPQYRGLSFEWALRRELSVVCPGISAAAGGAWPNWLLLVLTLLLCQIAINRADLVGTIAN